MMKNKYESPELDIQWFENEDICAPSKITEEIPGDGVVDEW